jgi:hypothetical protein
MNNIEQSILNDDKMISFAQDKNIKLKEFRDSISESFHIEYTLRLILTVHAFSVVLFDQLF